MDMIKKFRVFFFVLLVLFGISISAVVFAENAAENEPVQSESKTLQYAEINDIHPQGEDALTHIDYLDSIERFQKRAKLFSAAKSNSNALTPAEQKIYDGILKGETEVDISEYNIPVVDRSFLFQHIDAHDPTLCYANVYRFAYISYYGTEVDGSLASVFFVYNVEPNQIQTRCQQLEAAKAKALSTVDGITDPCEQVLQLHDYLALNTAYAYERLQSGTNTTTDHSAYGVLVDHTGVCDGYAKAMDYLLADLNIPAVEVSSKVLNHSWNMVQLNGNWYHIDVTWDDPVFTINGKTGDKPGYVQYKNFLRTKEGIIATEHIGPNKEIDWQGAVETTDTRYETIPHNDNGVQEYYNGKWYIAKINNSLPSVNVNVPNTMSYYTVPAGEIIQCNMDGTSAEQLMTEAMLQGIQECSGQLYFGMQDKICKLNPAQRTYETAYALTPQELGSSPFVNFNGMYPVDNCRIRAEYYQNGSNELKNIDLNVDITDIQIKGQSLSLNGDIAVNFYLDLSQYTDKYDFAVKFWRNDDSTHPVYCCFNANEKDEEDNYYRFTYDVAAKEMTDIIHAQPVIKNSNGEYETCGEEKTYSVQQYAENMINDSALTDLLVAMLNYGTAAQNHFGYRTDAPANSILTDKQKEVPSAEISDDYKEVVTVTENAKAELIGNSLVLKSQTQLKYYYTLNDETEKGNLVFVYHQIGSEQLQSMALTYDTSKKMYYGIINDLAAKDLGNMYVGYVADKNDLTTPVSDVCKYGPMSYAINYKNDDNALGALMHAMANYWQRAQIYFQEDN